MTVDWSVLELDGVDEVVQRAARKVSDDYPHTIEYDDAYQEGLLNLAQNAAATREFVLSDRYGIIFHRLLMDLYDLVRVDGGHRSKQSSYERMLEGATE